MWRIRTSSGAVHNLFLLITVCCWFAHILLTTPDAPFAADKIFVFIWLFTSKNIVINDKIRATFSQEHFKNIASKEQIITKGKATYFNKSLLAETVGFEPTVPVKVQLISSSCHTGSLCPSLSLISAKITELVTALLPLPRKMHGFLKAKGTGGH